MNRPLKDGFEDALGISMAIYYNVGYSLALDQVHVETKQSLQITAHMHTLDFEHSNRFAKYELHMCSLDQMHMHAQQVTLLRIGIGPVLNTQP